MSRLRDFFGAAVLIDDDFPVLTGGTVIPEDEIAKRPLELFSAFQEEGAVISPFPFTSDEPLKQAIALALKARLTVLDWQLLKTDKEKRDRVQPAVDVVRHVCERKDAGMRWIIVYTRENTREARTELLRRLIADWEKEPPVGRPELCTEARAAQEQFDGYAGRLNRQYTDLEFLLTRNVASSTSVDDARRAVVLLEREYDETPVVVNGTFITFTSKKTVRAAEVFDEFAKSLDRVFGPLAVALLETATEIEKSSFRVLRQFAMPFELSIYLHALTAEIDDQQIPSLVFRMYADSMLEAGVLSPSVLEEIRTRRTAGIADTVKYLVSGDRLLPLLTQSLQGLFQLEAKADLLGALKAVGEGLGQGKSLDWCLSDARLKPFKLTRKVSRAAFETLVAFVQWRMKKSAPQVEDFLAELKMQSRRFTSLLKFSPNVPRNKVETGIIFVDKLTRTRYLLCITPYCDVARPADIDHRYKFLVGYQNNSVAPKKVRSFRESQKRHGTFVPKDNDLRFIVWDFYNTEVHQAMEPTIADKWAASDFSFEFLQQNHVRLCAQLEGLDESFRYATLMVAATSADRDFMRTVALGLRLLDEDEGQSQTEEAASALDLILENMGHYQPNVLLPQLPILGFLAQYEPVALLRREYVQQIINKYVAYHSRAGVEEIYYKEWSEELLDIFR